MFQASRRLVSSLSCHNPVLTIKVELVEKIRCAIFCISIGIHTSSQHALFQTTALQTIGTRLADSCEWNPQVGILQRILLLDESVYFCGGTLEVWVCFESSRPVRAICCLVRVVLLVWLRASKDGCPALFVITVSRSCITYDTIDCKMCFRISETELLMSIIMWRSKQRLPPGRSRSKRGNVKTTTDAAS